MRVVFSVTLGTGSKRGGSCCGGMPSEDFFLSEEGAVRCTPTIFDQNRISNAEHPNSVIIPKGIQVSAAGWTCISANRAILLKMIQDHCDS